MTISWGSMDLWSRIPGTAQGGLAPGLPGMSDHVRGFFGDVGGALKGMYQWGAAKTAGPGNAFGNLNTKRLGVGGAIAGGGLLLSGMMGGPGLGLGLLAAGGAAGAAYAGGRMGVGGAVMGSLAVMGTVGAGRLAENFDISGAVGMVAAGSMFAGGFMSARGGSGWSKPFRFAGGMLRGAGTIPTAMGRAAGGWKPYSKTFGTFGRAGHLLAGSAMLGSMFGVGNLLQTGNVFGSFSRHMGGMGGMGRGTTPNIPMGYRMGYPY